ncbi:hypothetical protein K2X85_21005 [bacterium]|nr:hypothetical protein [bacterium]
MRSRFAAIVAALALTVSSVHAELYSMYTNPNPAGPATPSTLGVTLVTLGGAVVIAIPPAAVTGTAVIDMNLDASDSGQLYVTTSTLKLANVSGNIPTILGNVFYDLQNVGVSIVFGPTTVTNGAFSLTSATPGTLSLNSGIVVLNTPLGNFNLNLNTDPVDLAFADLGNVIIGGRADDSSLVGSDKIDSNPHTQGAAGLTGLSVIDDDGSEILVSWSGVGIATTISGLPSTISLTGSGLYVGVPEASTVLMMGMASSVVGLMVVRRRRNG